MFKYKEVEQKKLTTLIEAYVHSLSGVYDDFLEAHILDSKFYVMTYDKEQIGYFAIFEERLLTQFFILDEVYDLAQACFKSILHTFNLHEAFIPTCDEKFLTLGMDFHKKVELQAYIFTETDREVDPPSFPKSFLRLANLSDVEMIKSLSGDFFDELYQMVSDRKIYILEDDEVYGFGIVEDNRIHTKYKGTGMFTVEKHRQKGVGRSIILHLKDLVHTLGYKALPACWYHNYNSKRTLESCGFITKTRLLKVEF